MGDFSSATLSGALQLLRRSPRLRRSLWAWLLVGLVFTEAVSLGLALAHSHDEALVAVAAAIWWALVGVFFLLGASWLRLPDGTAIDYYGIPNGLSVLRAWCCLPLLLTTSLSLPDRWNLICFSVLGGTAGMLDYVDGQAARRIGPITMLGKALDPAGDALLFSVGAVAASQVGIMPTWLVGVILVRYLGPMLLTPVVFLLHRRPELVHTRWGRINTALVGLVFFILMWVRIFNGPVDAVAFGVGVPLLVPTALLHFVSLFQRVRSAPESV